MSITDNDDLEFIFGDEIADERGVEYDKKINTMYKKWGTFYRLNFDVFVEHYLGINNLKLFQKIMLYLMGLSEIFVTVASRGISKSYTIALYIVSRAILYPGSNIILSSGTKGQSALIISEKIIGDFWMKSATLRLEIKSFTVSQNKVEVVFKNGSRILAVTANNNSRGYRGNVLVMDEFRLIKQDIKDEVLIPMLNVPRMPMYLNDPKFDTYAQEENIQIYISSAYYATEWIYKFSKETLMDVLVGKEGIFFLAMDYTLSLKERLTTEKYMENQRRKMDEVSFAMEFDTIFYGQSKNALFAYDVLKRARVIKEPFEPLRNEDYLLERDKFKEKIHKKRKSGELRVIGVDVALIGGKENDASQFICMRLIPKGTRYVRKIDYIESMEGVHSFTQSIRLKQLFEDYDADFVAMDCNGTSLSLYEQVSTKQLDPERGVNYEAWAAINNEDLKVRVLSENPLNVVYSVIPTAWSNHNMSQMLRQCFVDGYIELLIDDQDALEEYIKAKSIEEYVTEGINGEEHAMKKARLLHPYLQTTALINEIINLEYEMSGGLIKILTKGSKRKDRFSSLLYANYFASIKEDENLKRDDESYVDAPLMARAYRV